jgi:hypothetical protein
VVGYCLLNLDFLLPKERQISRLALKKITNLRVYVYIICRLSQVGARDLTLSYSCDVCTSVVLLRTATCSSIIGQVIFLSCPDSRCLFLIAYS